MSKTAASTRADSDLLRLFGGQTRSRPWRSLVGASIDPVHPVVEAHGASDRGKVRADNQDQFLVAELERGLLVRGSSLSCDDETSVTDSPQGYLLAVADGVGGNRGGDVASAIAVDTVAHYALTMMPWVIASDAGDASLRGLRRAVKNAQERMRRLAERHGLSSDMATTFTMAYVTWPDLRVVHVGDSRCYLLRADELRQLTRDHTVAETLIDQGVDPEAVRGTRLAHTLDNAVGGSHAELSVELHCERLEPDDALLLCSDGLTAYLSDEELAARLGEERSAEDIATALVKTANDRGGGDNITAVVARF